MRSGSVVKTIYLVSFTIIALVCFAVFGELLPVSPKRDSPRSFGQVLQTFVDNVSGQFSRSEILMGHRKWVGSIENHALRFHGMAFTFLDLDDSSTFVPYAFDFNGSEFFPAPAEHAEEIAALFARYKAPFADSTPQTPDGCVEPSPETGDTVRPDADIICRLPSLLPNARPAVIGVLRPDPTTLPLEDGDALCRKNVQRWLKMPDFRGIEVALCVITDRPYQADAHSAGNWMDILFYQKRGTRLLNMRGERRNFQRI